MDHIPDTRTGAAVAGSGGKRLNSIRLAVIAG
jgi:hypothetical protein